MTSSTGRAAGRSSWADEPAKQGVLVMLTTSLLLFAANIHRAHHHALRDTLVPDPALVTFIAGLAMSAAALGSILSAPRLGRLADRIGHASVIILALIAADILLIPQVLVTTGWH